jgi:predicted RNase H-like HicB family nuclease
MIVERSVEGRRVTLEFLPGEVIGRAAGLPEVLTSGANEVEALNNLKDAIETAILARQARDPSYDDDNPEWTEEDFARARPGSEMPPEVLAAFGKRPKS